MDWRHTDTRYWTLGGKVCSVFFEHNGLYLLYICTTYGGRHQKSYTCQRQGPAVGYRPAQRVTYSICLKLLRVCTRRDPHLRGLIPLSCSKVKFYLCFQQRVLGFTWTMCVELLRVYTPSGPHLRGSISLLCLKVNFGVIFGSGQIDTRCWTLGGKVCSLFRT